VPPARQFLAQFQWNRRAGWKFTVHRPIRLIIEVSCLRVLPSGRCCARFSWKLATAALPGDTGLRNSCAARWQNCLETRANANL